MNQIELNSLNGNNCMMFFHNARHCTDLYMDISSSTCLLLISQICIPFAETVSATFGNFFPEDFACTNQNPET